MKRDERQRAIRALPVARGAADPGEFDGIATDRPPPAGARAVIERTGLLLAAAQTRAAAE